MITRLYILFFIALTMLSACAKASEQQIQDIQTHYSKIDTDIREWEKKVDTFLTSIVGVLYAQFFVLSNYDGIQEIWHIHKNYIFTKKVEGEERALLKKNIALEQWTLKWKQDGQEIYSRADSLLTNYVLSYLVIYNALISELDTIESEQISLLSKQVSLELISPNAGIGLMSARLDSRKHRESRLSKEMEKLRPLYAFIQTLH